MNTSFEVIKLKLKSPLHIGRGWGDLDHSDTLLHSDTLKSAIYSVLIQLYTEWKNKAEEFFYGFNISSCFPYYENEFFLPKIQLKRKFEFKGISEEKHAKTSKNIEFISFEVFKNYLNNDSITVSEKQLSADSKFIFEKELDEKIYVLKSHVQQRVKISGFDETDPFFSDRIFFSEKAGIYFLVSFKDENLKHIVLQSLKILGNYGVGTDRTVGNGFFEIDEEISKLEFKVDNADAFATLGLYLPDKEEVEKIDLDNSSWGLVKRDGYMSGSEFIKFRHLLKKSIYMFTEGSVFKTLKQPKGKFVEVKPDWNDNDMHNVWRCGMPLFIPVKL